MTTDDQNSANPPEPIAYRDGQANIPAPGHQVLAAIGWGILTVVIVVAVGFVWAIDNLYFGSPRSTRPPVNWILPAICSVTGLAVITGMVATAWRRGRGVVLAGICIAMGLTLLLEGFCFLHT